MVAHSSSETQPLGRALCSRFGRYQVLELIARGGMGGVHLGCDLHTGERVALKILDPDFASNAEVIARLRAELTISTSVPHPGLLEIRAVGRSSDGLPFLVMEYLDGVSLGVLVERGPLELELVISCGAQIAAAVAALHAGGIIHCDLKPENVIAVAGRGLRVKVVDFGVARFVADPFARDGDAIAGTPMCMAPEQWRGEPVPASDVYALGCLLYELATGDQPFSGSITHLMIAHRDQRPARPSWLRQQLPAGLERLILWCLAKDSAFRPTMAELASALASLRSDVCSARAS